MIIIKAIDGKNGSKKPESIPTTKWGSHFDGTNFYFFESKSEADNFYASQPVQEQVPLPEEKIDLIKILSKITPEEKEYLKNLLK